MDWKSIDEFSCTGKCRNQSIDCSDSDEVEDDCDMEHCRSIVRKAFVDCSVDWDYSADESSDILVTGMIN